MHHGEFFFFLSMPLGKQPGASLTREIRPDCMSTFGLHSFVLSNGTKKSFEDLEMWSYPQNEEEVFIFSDRLILAMLQDDKFY